jgi:hypothetical protein
VDAVAAFSTPLANPANPRLPGSETSVDYNQLFEEFCDIEAMSGQVLSEHFLDCSLPVPGDLLMDDTKSYFAEPLKRQQYARSDNTFPQAQECDEAAAYTTGNVVDYHDTVHGCADQCPIEIELDCSQQTCNPVIFDGSSFTDLYPKNTKESKMQISTPSDNNDNNVLFAPLETSEKWIQNI